MIITQKPKINKKRYTFTLDQKLVEEAEQLISGVGGKLSPLVEKLLEGFVENAKLSPEEFVLTKESQIKKLEAMQNKVKEQIDKLKKNKEELKK